MRRFGYPALALAALLAGPAWAYSADTPAEKAAPACSKHNTQVDFFDTPSDAATQAKKDGKLVFVLHISGYFEDPKLTWNNAEALRVNALAAPEVGKYLNENFCSAYQKVGTFKVVGANKQGGNVASYFCAPDGRVLHCVAGPVNSDVLLREAKWVVETTEKAIKESKGDGAKFKAFFRTAHADRLRNEHGLVVEPVTFDPPIEQDPKSALTYNDPTGRPLAPVLKPVPIDGPDVIIRAKVEQAQKAAAPGAGGFADAALMKNLADRRGRGWAIGPQGQVHHIMAGHAMVKIEKVFATVFENILGEKVSTAPVEVVTPFPWANRDKLDRVKLVPAPGGR